MLKSGDICGPLEPRGWCQGCWVAADGVLMLCDKLSWLLGGPPHRPHTSFPCPIPHPAPQKALIICHPGIFSHTWLQGGTHSIILDYKGHQGQNSGPWSWKIALLATVEARSSTVSRACQVIYTCSDSHDITHPHPRAPALGCFPVTPQSESEPVVHRGTSGIGWMTTVGLKPRILAASPPQPISNSLGNWIHGTEHYLILHYGNSESLAIG